MKLSFCKRVTIVLPVFFIFLVTAFSQTTVEKKSEASPWGFKLSGFVRNDIMIDSRQTVNSTEGDIAFYPADVVKDVNGADKNAAASFNMLPISSRVTANITGADAFGAKTSAFFEGEFLGFGNGTTLNNVFGLRHAYIKLDWPRTQLGFGQFWHPLYNPEVAPSQLGFSGGMPFVPYNRSPQIRLTQKLSNQFNLILAAVTERDYESVIPANTAGLATFTAAGVTSPDGMRNSVVPDLNVQLIYKSNAVLFGAALDYKSLRPALAVTTGTTGAPSYVSNKRVNSLTYEIYGKVTTKDFMVKAEYVSGQNMTDLIMLGGYIAYGTVPDISYKPTSVSSYWIDVCGTGKKVMPGIFAGYTKNNGASDVGGIAAYGRGLSVTANTNGIDHVLRVVPRIEFISGKFKFGTELEVTTAAYGSPSTSADVTGTTIVVTNVRGLFVTTFSF